MNQEIEPYLERHYPENQQMIEGIAINPEQRWDFDITPNEDRPEKEIRDWFDVPYITTQGFGRDTYQEYVKRMSSYSDIDTKEEYTKRRTEEKLKWDLWYPTGYRYNVRRLDGGAWDRSTNLGHFITLEDAIDFIENMK